MKLHYDLFFKRYLLYVCRFMSFVLSFFIVYVTVLPFFAVRIAVFYRLCCLYCRSLLFVLPFLSFYVVCIVVRNAVYIIVF